MKTFTAYIEWDPETRQYVGIVPGIPGAHTQAETLDGLRENLKEVLGLCPQERGSQSSAAMSASSACIRILSGRRSWWRITGHVP